MAECTDDIVYAKNIEVCGNIHDNHELFKGVMKDECTRSIGND